MSRLLILLGLLLLVGLPIAAQEPIPGLPELPPWWNDAPPDLPTPEPTIAAPTLADYEWCGYLLLDGVIVDADALALLGTLFPNEPDTPTQARLQWRANLAGTAGILEGCHLLPVERWRVVSLLQQATGMEYAQMDAALQFTQFPNADAVRAFLEQHAAEWEPADAPIPEATNEPA